MRRKIMPSRRIGHQEPKLSEASKRVEARGEAGGLDSTAEWDHVSPSRRSPNQMNPWDPMWRDFRVSTFQKWRQDFVELLTHPMGKLRLKPTTEGAIFFFRLKVAHVSSFSHAALRLLCQLS